MDNGEWIIAKSYRNLKSGSHSGVLLAGISDIYRNSKKAQLFQKVGLFLPFPYSRENHCRFAIQIFCAK